MAAGFAGVLVGLVPALWIMRRLRGRRGAGLILASALLASFGLGYNNREQNLIQDCRDGARRRQNKRAGDPPDPD